MSKLKFFVLSLSLLSFLQVRADWDLWQSYIILNSSYYAGPTNPDLATSFANVNFGQFTTGGSLLINGGELKTYKNNTGGNSNVCGGDLYYRVYRTCDTAPAFSTFNLPYDSELGGGNQKWDETGLSINVISGLTLPGTYVLEVYWRVWGGQFGGCDYYKFDPDDPGSSSSTYIPASFVRAYFDFNVTDSFTDNNVTASPVWSGDTGSWTIASNSDAGTATGSETLQSRTLRLAAPAVSQTEHLSTPVASWDGNQEWYFWMGRRAQAATGSNFSTFWLYANESNLESGTVDGYRVLIGDDVAGDQVQLQSVTNGTGTTFLSSLTEIPNGATDWGIAFYISRSQTGLWTLRTSAIPTGSGTGATALACPATVATVVHGTATNNTYPLNSAGYIGCTAFHSTGTNAIAGAEFDNIRFVPLPFNTSVYFDVASNTYNETEGVANIAVHIANFSTTAATSVDVVLTSGDGSRINGFTSQTLTFPASSGTSQTATVVITDNNLCDDIANLTLTLQNVTGGNSAFIASPSSFALTIVDDNMGYQTLLTDNFEDGNVTGWDMSPSAYWEASTFIPCSGTYSARSADVNVASQSTFTSDLDGANLAGQTTEWRFNLRYNSDPSPNNNFQVFLASNESALWSATVDGYAVGVNPLISGDPDIITLWQVDNGTPTTAIVTSVLDWGNGTVTSEVGFEITRSEAGLWTLKVDENGDFDALTTIGTGTNTVYERMDHFGVRYIFTAGLDNALAFDDISVTQKGCIATYYTQGSGNVSDPIWDDVPVGVGGTINPGRYSSLVVQAGHTVTQTANLVSSNFSIDASGTVNAGAFEHRTYGNWTNNGSYNAGTGTVYFKSNFNQSVSGVTTFNDIRIDNDGFNVTLNGATSVNGEVYADEGTLVTNGNLTLLSTSANHAASIGRIQSGADVTGNVTLQRHVPSWTYNGIGQNQGGTWINLGCALNGPLTMADWNDDMITTGFTGSDYPPPYTFINIASYNEAVPGDRNLGYVYASDITNALSGGYFVFLPYSAHTVDVSGTINKGSFVQTVNYTNSGNLADGFNLLTNLYPSEIDWDMVVQNGSGATTHYIYDRDLPGYRAYNGFTQAGTGSRYVASSQSFFTYSNPSAGGLQYNESYKTNTGGAFVRSRDESSFISLRIEHGGMADEAIAVFMEGASAEFENDFDALKMENDFVMEAPELALISSDNQRLTIHTAQHNGQGSIPIWIDAPLAGDYSLVVNEMRNLPAGACFTIEDLATGQNTVVENGALISFTIDETYSGVRFIIHTTPSVQVQATDATCPGGMGEVLVQSYNGNINLEITNTEGEVEYDALMNAALVQLEAGTYFIALDNSSDLCNVSTTPIVIAEPQKPVMEIYREKANCKSPSGVIEIALQNAGSYNYSIANSSGALVAEGSSSDHALRFEELTGDVYAVTVSTPCETLTAEVDLRDANTVEAQIVSPTELTTGAPATFESQSVGQEYTAWMVDHRTVYQSEIMTHTFEKAGEHVVTLFVGNEKCSHKQVQSVFVKDAPVVPAAESTSDISVINFENGFEIVMNDVLPGDAVLVYSSHGQLVHSQNLAQSARNFVSTNGMARGSYSIQVIRAGQSLHAETIVR